MMALATLMVDWRGSGGGRDWEDPGDVEVVEEEEELACGGSGDMMD